MSFSNTVLTPPTIPRATFRKEDSVESLKGRTILEVGITLKSSLKQHRYGGVLDPQTGLDIGGEVSRRRSVQWIDKLGRELADLREFEPSDVGEEELDPFYACSCSIQ